MARFEDSKAALTAHRGLATCALFGLLAVAAPGSAPAMANASQPIRCTVEGQAKLAAGLRGDNALCGPLTRALAGSAAKAGVAGRRVALKLRATSPYRLGVTMLVDGVALPERKLTSADRPIGPDSINRLATSLANQLAEHLARRRHGA